MKLSEFERMNYILDVFDSMSITSLFFFYAPEEYNVIDDYQTIDNIFHSIDSFKKEKLNYGCLSRVSNKITNNLLNGVGQSLPLAVLFNVLEDIKENEQ